MGKLTEYGALVNRGHVRHHGKFSEEGLAPKWVPYYESGARVEVRFSSGEVKRGRVGATTGWKPSFMLMLRTSDHGSSWLLGEGDEALRVISK